MTIIAITKKYDNSINNANNNNSSAIASWLQVVLGGFWLVGNGFSWFAVLVVIVANNYLLFV